jgi:hypothetical protein
MSDWDRYEAAEIVEIGSEVAVWAEELSKLTVQKDILAARVEQLTDQLAAEFKEESGEQSMRVGADRIVICTRSERWVWDTEILEEIISSKPELPTHIKRALSIDKRKFENLDDQTKRELLPALTRKAGKAAIKILEIG